uniref:PPM-type phosphatase domain-containing protein n=1 Tax=Xiphophorus couchianus TaxID=32473 RepID=A0A3B5MFI5_9TELE
MAVPSIIYNKTEEINSVSINIHLVPPKHPAVVHQLIFLLLLQVLLVLEVIMLRRSGAQTRRCWLEIQQSRYLSSAPAPPELRRLHYPASSRSRQGQAGQESGQLSPAQINRILKANEHSHTLPRGPASHGVLGFHSNTLPSNHPSEDRRSSATCLLGRGGVLFGVFDGHAGPSCAQAISQRLFYYFTVAMLPLRTLQELDRAVEEDRAVPPLLEWHKHPQDHSSLDGGAISFHSLRNYWQERLDEDDEEDNEVTSLNLPKMVGGFSLSSPLRVALSGSTACVVHVSNGVLHVANLGDSRAVLGVQEGDGRWSALSLTNDHSAQNPEELQRILGEHPASERKTVVRHDRLLGLLLPFRAFGDVRFKWSPEMLSRLYDTRPDVLSAVSESVRTLPPHYLTPPYLSAQPEVTRHLMKPADKFLVLATDGLWELMHRQTVVQLVGDHVAGLQQQRPIVPSADTTLGSLQRLLLERRDRVQSVLEDQNVATHLLRHALGDDGYGSVDQNRLARMLSLPADLARRYRDDITITVIHLNDL